MITALDNGNYEVTPAWLLARYEYETWITEQLAACRQGRHPAAMVPARKGVDRADKARPRPDVVDAAIERAARITDARLGR